MTQSNKQRKTGFTLIELLVVIAIISLLVSILLPSLNTAKELAKRVKCVANIKGIGTGLVIYANDNSSQLPHQYWYSYQDASPPKLDAGAWIRVPNALGYLCVGNYLDTEVDTIGKLTLDNKPRLLECPCDQGLEMWQRRNWSSYLYQSPFYTLGGATDPDKPNTIEAANPGWALLMDVGQAYLGWAAPHPSGTDPRVGIVCVGYADGHVEQREFLDTTDPSTNPDYYPYYWPRNHDIADPR